MIIQHNIMALNSYNRLASNNSTVSKNIEKLSSGFKINRAGDDAAGLAISEKMRAQVTGLDRATQNAQDGISLVQTAEGQLTEVHSMLNRMVDLSTQASNGTVDNDVDRKNLQLEITSLKEEIDRIATTSNFNGIKLLDGSLGSTSASGVAVDVKYDNLAANASLLKLNSATYTSATGTADVAITAAQAGKGSIELRYIDANGALQNKTVEVNLVKGDTGADNNVAIETALKGAFGDGYNVTYDNTGKLTVTSKTAGAGDKLEFIGTPTLKGADGTTVTGGFGTITPTVGADAYYTMDTTKLKSFDGTNFAGNSFEINGQKFAFTDATSANKLDPSVNYIEVATPGAIVAADVTKMIKLINDKTGIGAAVNGTTSIDLKAGTKAGTAGKGLSLQIGDTADQRVTVSIDNMGTKALGLDGVNVSTEKQATDSIDVVKKAINTVSTQRAKLGAVQNRLEHTINNLTTTSENMTAAESRIRDTDMAKEMMHFTKNNVLSQAAQAMLAQANQQPQQVLQLLR